MTQVTSAPNTGWGKADNPELAKLTAKSGRWKFLVGGFLILVSVVFLVISSTLSGAQYFVTVEDLMTDTSYAGQTIRISGAVIGDTIEQNMVRVVDNNRNAITFTISHIPNEFDNLAEALNASVNDPSAMQLMVYYEGAMPDLLQHEAQAILTGELGEDGIFYANELLLKCPSRFEDGGSNENLGEDHPGMQRIEVNAS